MTHKFDIDKLDIVLRHKDGKVVAGIPQIALFATGDDAAAALKELERKKELLRGDIAVAAVDDLLPHVSAVDNRLPVDGIGQFAVKSAIVATMVMLVLALSGALVANRIESTARRIAGTELQGGRQFWTNLENRLEREADPANDMSEERKQKLISSIRTVVNRWRPIAAEIGALFAPPPASR